MSRIRGLRGARQIWFASTLYSVAVLAAPLLAQPPHPVYPPSRAEETFDEIHGVKVADPFRWLENGDAEEVQKWTAAQNELTRRELDQFTDLRKTIKARLEELNDFDVSSAPRIAGKAQFFTRKEGLKNQPLIYRRTPSDDEPTLVLDANKLSEDGTVAVDWWFPSPDGALIVYGISPGGNERSTLHLRDAEKAADTALTIPNTRSCEIAWDFDGGGFLYTRYPEKGSVPDGDENYFRRVYYHKFGTEPKNDKCIFGEKTEKTAWNGCSTSSDFRYQFVTTSLDWAKNDIYFRKSGDTDLIPLAVGLDGRFDADVDNDTIYIHTDFQAPRFHIYSTSVKTPEQKNWKEVVPQQDGVIQAMALTKEYVAVALLEDAYSRIRLFPKAGGEARSIELPGLGSVDGLVASTDGAELFFQFQSYAFPPTVFAYDVAKETLREIDRPKVKIDPTAYSVKQVWFESKDKTRVPMFVIHREGVERDGKNPTVLYGYGGFNISQKPTFVPSLFPWLDAGGIYAIANLRGGGEFGKDWHLAGRGANKQKVFDDMIAAGEKLVADKYTSPAKLGCYGGSNGGLLTGAMIVQRPDLFRAVHSAVPLLDMLRYQNMKIAKLWIPEYGSAEDATQFKTLLAYSPYHNVKVGTRYPAVLISTAENDSRVDPMHARKMAAALQTRSASEYPVLLWVETKAGHGAGKPLSKKIESQVDNWVFFMWQLGVFEEK